MTTLYAFLLFAQDKAKKAAEKAGEAAEPSQPMWAWFVPMILIFVVFYFLIILPQKRQQRKMQEQMGAIKKNDKVVTHSGIIGVVSYIDDKDNEVTLRLEEGKIRVLKTAIARIYTDEKAQEANKDKQVG